MADDRVAQLEKKLQKAEVSRRRLKEGLEKAKHSAADTNELLRQHILLQQTAARAAAEMDGLRRSRAEAEERLASTQADNQRLAAQANREREQAQAQLAALQTQLERMQRATVYAKLESARALGAAQKCEAELANTRKQALATRERIKDIEHQQKADHNAAATSREQLACLSGQVRALDKRVAALEGTQPAMPAATAEDVDALRDQLLAVLERLARAEAAAEAAAVWHGDKQSAALEALHQRVAASDAEQARLAMTVVRLNGVVSAFARAVNAPAAELAEDSCLALPAAPGLGRQPWGASGAWGHDAPRTLPAASTSGGLGDAAAPGAALALQGCKRAPHVHASERDFLAGVPACPASPPQPTGLRAGAGPQESRPSRKRPRPGSGLSAGVEGSNATASPAAPAACLASSCVPDRTGCSGASAAAQLPAAEATAAEAVEGWLTGLTRSAAPIDAAQAARAAAGLQAALASGDGPLPCVTAGFETAFLECAAAMGPGLVPRLEVGLAGTDAGLDGATHGPAWCSEDARCRGVFVWLLRCACDLDARLRAGGHSAGVLEPLRAHMHARAVAPAVNPRSFDTEACALCAATAELCRLLGAVQAMRVFVYELLRAHAGHPAALLPRLLAALAAWPGVLSGAAAAADLVGRMVLAAAHDIVQDVLRALPCPADDTATVLGFLASSTAEAACGADVVAAAQQLCEMGGRLWGWGEQGGGLGLMVGSSVQWGALQGELRVVLKTLSAQPEAVPPLVGALRALDLALACLGPSACSLPAYPGVLAAVERSASSFVSSPAKERLAELGELLGCLVRATLRCEGESALVSTGLTAAHMQLLHVRNVDCNV